MNNNFRYDNYGYRDMSVLTDLFMQPNNNQNQAQNQNQFQNQNQLQNQQFNNNQNLAEPYEGYIRGNLFNNLYQQYQNYRPSQLVPSNEQAELLLNVNQLTFATHELNLYLDVHPEDQNMIRLFNQYQAMAKEAIDRYEQKYGPLTINNQSNPEVFSWQAYSWPWEMEEM